MCLFKSIFLGLCKQKLELKFLRFYLISNKTQPTQAMHHVCYLPNICTVRYHQYIIILFWKNVHFFLWDNMDKEFSSTSDLKNSF